MSKSKRNTNIPEPSIQVLKFSLRQHPGIRTETQVIFSCGGGIGNSVMAAAEANKGLVIGVDVDQLRTKAVQLSLLLTSSWLLL